MVAGILLESRGGRPMKAVWFVVFSVGLGAAGLGAYVWSTRAEAFDQQRWRECDVTTSTRAAMAEDLVRSGRLIGLSKDDVVRLLGEPNASRYCPRAEFGFALGAERGFVSIDSEWMCLRLGPKGKVIEVYLKKD
jgi:hypothetical protein